MSGDIFIVESTLAEIKIIKFYLNRKFEIKNLDLLRYFLGIKVLYSNDGIIRSHLRVLLA